MMWRKTLPLLFLILCALSESHDIEDEDYDEEDDIDDLGEEPKFLDSDQDFHNELFDNLIRTSIVNYPKTVIVHFPNLLISDRPFQITAKSGVFEDVHTLERVSPMGFQEFNEMLAFMSVSLKFGTFSVTYDGFAFTLGKFTAAGRIVVKVLDNEFYMGVTGGKEGERCFVRADSIEFNKLKKFQLEYFSSSKRAKSAKCDKNVAVFRSFFYHIFVNAVKPTFTRRLSDTMNGFVRSIEESVCTGE